jgi:hypothetical protein
MNARRRTFKMLHVLLLVLLGLFVAWLAAIASGVLPRLTAAEREALAQMRAPYADARGERNAFELFWLLPRNVPVAERAAVFAADMAAVDGHRAGRELDLPSARYPRHAEGSSSALRGCSSKPGCLAAVRADPEGVRATLAERASLLAGLDEIGTYDHLRTPHRPNFAAPIPEYQQTGPLQLARAALRHVDGDRVGALDGLCRDLSGWRRLKGRSDSLVFEMVVLAWLQGGVQLAADLRAEAPAGEPLPSECIAALAPLAKGERMSCDVFRGEFRTFDGMLAPEQMLASPAESAPFERVRAYASRFAYSAEGTRALLARHLANACAARDSPNDVANLAPPQCGFEARVFNPIGCVLSEVAMADYGRYHQREREFDTLARRLAPTPPP